MTKRCVVGEYWAHNSTCGTVRVLSPLFLFFVCPHATAPAVVATDATGAVACDCDTHTQEELHGDDRKQYSFPDDHTVDGLPTLIGAPGSVALDEPINPRIRSDAKRIRANRDHTGDVHHVDATGGLNLQSKHKRKFDLKLAVHAVQVGAKGHRPNTCIAHRNPSPHALCVPAVLCSESTSFHTPTPLCLSGLRLSPGHSASQLWVRRCSSFRLVATAALCCVLFVLFVF